MKRRDLLRLIATGARGGGIPWRFVRQGTDHEVWRCGAVRCTSLFRGIAKSTR